MLKIGEKEIPSTLEDYLYALQQRNLVYNHDFRYFSNQMPNQPTMDYGIPDGWQYEDPGPDGRFSFNPETQQIEIIKSSGEEEMMFKQAIHEFPRWQQQLLGKTITAKVCLVNSAGSVMVSLTDGIDTSTRTVKEAGETEVVVSLQVNEEAQSVYIIISSSVAFSNIKISQAFANVGNIALENLACIVKGIIGQRHQYVATETPPAEELSLCNAPIELCSEPYPNTTRLNTVINHRFGTGPNGYSLLIDMRGYFSRAWDHGAGVDPDAEERTFPRDGEVIGDKVGTFEGDVFLKHDHGLNFALQPGALGGDKAPITVINAAKTSETEVEDEGLETRSVNIMELFTIVWA
ncbi:MAG: hypothetical protein AAFR61_05325 [Bacteroidota bacterium]